MPFVLSPLPYAADALSPHISKETIEFHYGKHHKGYLDKLNRLVEGTPLAQIDVVEIMIETQGSDADKATFNNAAQVFNHDFYWRSMKPNGGGAPTGAAAEAIERAFDGYEGFRKAFASAATGLFGSGYVWLVQDGESLAIVATGNAANPVTEGKTPLLTIDVWEHAYYIDRRNDRAAYVEAFLTHLANWDFVNAGLAAAASGKGFRP